MFLLFPDTFGRSQAPQARGEACVTVFERRSHLGPPAEGRQGPSNDDDGDDYDDDDDDTKNWHFYFDLDLFFFSFNKRNISTIQQDARVRELCNT